MYRPVWRSLPLYPEWNRITTETIFEPIGNGYYKFSWTFEPLVSENDHYFAFTNPYPYCDVMKNISAFEKICPNDTVFHRETLIRSLDGRDVDLITISQKYNFSDEREESIYGLFPLSSSRCFKGLKPIVFISARVHPGETPASFLLDGILQVILSPDTRGASLRSNFVFKIIPVLNPDGVYRGNFRVDQNGVNLNRCYLEPSLLQHPSIYAVKTYFTSLVGVKYYFDLHAHVSKRSCFLFGNYLPPDFPQDNQVFAKLIELNTPYFEFSECDFSEKSMIAKDPKDHHSKEGSGRVALYQSTGIIHSYTIECSYYISRPLHPIPQSINIKTGRKFVESVLYNLNGLIQVYNRGFFNDMALGILMAVLDMELLNTNSRLPLSEFRNLDSIRDYLRARSLIQSRILNKNFSKGDMKKGEKRHSEKFQILPRVPLRKIHKLNVVTPMFGSAPQALGQKPRLMPVTRGKSMIGRS